MSLSVAELQALQIYAATIKNCQRMQPKFAAGTAQASLLTNRIRALRVITALVGQTEARFDAATLAAAVAPIDSIIHKTTAARGKYAPCTAG